MAGGGGQGSPLMRALGQINQAESMARPAYTPPSQLAQQNAGYQSTYAPQQVSPIAQQMMQRSMAPQPMQPITGLPAALMQMQGRLNQPMIRAPMPTYQNPALAYRPNMAPAMEALNRVRPSVYKTELDAARERLAQYEAAQQPQDTGYYYYGG